MIIAVVTDMINHEIKLFKHVEDARLYVHEEACHFLMDKRDSMGLPYSLDEIAEEATEVVIQAEESPWFATMYTIEEMEVM